MQRSARIAARFRHPGIRGRGPGSSYANIPQQRRQFGRSWSDLTTLQIEKAPSLPGAFLLIARTTHALCAFLIGQRPTLPHTRACSTIGAEGLNFRVRDGNGWDPLAKVTQKSFFGSLKTPAKLRGLCAPKETSWALVRIFDGPLTTGEHLYFV